MGALTLQAVRKSFGDSAVIQGIDLAVQDGEFMVFVGPSGCGKSTTLRMIAGLETITSGDLAIDNQRMNDVHPADRGVAMVFQSYALYPHMTVAENMGFALKMAGVGKADREQQVKRAAEALRMDHLLSRYPKELSGGERQRVAIGRAIVRKPKIFLFDEPLSNLDAALRVEMRIELTRLHKELGVTMVYVTHDQVEAMTMGDRIAVFNKGRIEQVGTPMALYQTPANTFVAQFLGSPRINLLHSAQLETAEAKANSSLQAWWQIYTAGANANASSFAIRPEHVGLEVPAAQGVSATVVLAEHLGDSSVYHCQVAGLPHLVHAKVSGGRAFHNGEATSLVFKPDRLLSFDAEGRATGS
jgi:multiple sugar transport system ATP-binding protein